MACRVRVPRTIVAIGGWKGVLEIHGDVLEIIGLNDPRKRLSIDCSQVKRGSFNSNNGLFALRMKDGHKHIVQMSGGLLSADRTDEGRSTTEQVGELLRKHGVRVWVH